MKKYDLCVKSGTYTDRNGHEKANWENVGVMMENGNGPFIILKSHFNPAGIPREDGRSSIIISLFPPKENGNEGSTTSDERTLSLSNHQNIVEEPIPF